MKVAGASLPYVAPRGPGGQLPDHKAAAPAERPSPAEAMAALEHAVSELGDLALPATLCACIQEGRLDFGGLAALDAEGAFIGQVNLLPPQAWRALAQLAQAQGQPLAHVELPAQVVAADMALVIRGLGELPALRSLAATLPDPPGRFSLAGAHLAGATPRGAPGAPVVLTLRGDIESVEDIAVPVNVRARAAPREREGPVAHEVMVRLVDDDGALVAQVALAHFNAWRHARELEASARQQGAGDGELRDVTQALAMSLPLNGAARFGDTKRQGEPLAPLVTHGQEIVCRHLSVQFLQDFSSYHRDGKAAAPFSMAGLSSAEAIAARVDPTTELAARDLSLGAQGVVFSQARLGEALAVEFESMQAGELRSFSVSTITHLMALGLHKIERHIGGQTFVEHEVTFYDPNTTALPQRALVHDLDDLRDKSLSWWLDESMQAGCFCPGTARVGSLARWPPGVSVGEPHDHVNASERVSGGFLYSAMLRGDAVETAQTVAALLAAGQQDDGALHAAMQELKAPALGEFPPALYRAVGWARTAAAMAYVRTVLAALVAPVSGAPTLTSGQAAHLLGDRHEGRTPLMAAALGSGTGTLALQMQEAILSAPGLDDRDRVSLLTAEDDDDPAPLLKRLSAAGAQAGGLSASDGHERLYGMVRALAQATTLPAADHAMLLNAEEAARAALDAGNPGAAAAMVCGVLDAGLPAQATRTRLGWLGVTPAQVREALDDSPDAAAWKERLEEALTQLPPAEGKHEVG